MLAVLAVPASNAAGLGEPVALVTAETQNRLVAVDLPSGRVLRRLAMPDDPQNVESDSVYAVVVSPCSGAVTATLKLPAEVGTASARSVGVRPTNGTVLERRSAGASCCESVSRPAARDVVFAVLP